MFVFKFFDDILTSTVSPLFEKKKDNKVNTCMKKSFSERNRFSFYLELKILANDSSFYIVIMNIFLNVEVPYYFILICV